MENIIIPQCVINFAEEKKQYGEKLKNKIISTNKLKVGYNLSTYCMDNYYFVSMFNKDSQNHLYIKKEYWDDEEENIEQEYEEYRFCSCKEKNLPPRFKLYEIRIYDKDERLHNLFGPSMLNFDLQSGEITRAVFYIDEQIYSAEQFVYKSRRELKDQKIIPNDDIIMAMHDTTKILESIIRNRLNNLYFQK